MAWSVLHAVHTKLDNNQPQVYGLAHHEAVTPITASWDARELPPHGRYCCSKAPGGTETMAKGVEQLVFSRWTAFGRGGCNLLRIAVVAPAAAAAATAAVAAVTTSAA
mmetsp:Transcript_71172/g.179771  ORF Transcript_71172/g.179771 Transcript_71172/m.179771 type:complete len:108 (-) Transcript_71172:1253-1576(-)